MVKIKKLLIFAAILFAIFVSSANAQLIGEECSVSDIDVINKISDTTHVELSYTFNCENSSAYQGQITKMLVKVPLTDIENLEASDSYGSMEVLEGPEYVGASKDTDETTIGVMFRKGLLIRDVSESYTVAVEFDTNSLVQKEDSVSSIGPGDLIDTVKVTIISTGITETTIPINGVYYRLELPSGSSINEISPAVCGIQSSKVICAGLSTAQFDEIQVKWSHKSQVEGWKNKLEGYTKDFIPKITNAFKGLTSKISNLLKGK